MENAATSNEVFVTGLRNAHAMEKQALAIMKPQLSRLENYPEVSELLDRHLRETRGQIQRIEDILQTLDESSFVSTTVWCKSKRLSVRGCPLRLCMG